MKSLIVSLFLAIVLVAGLTAFSANAADVQKLYVQASHDVDFTNPEFNSQDINVEARAKAKLFKGFGIDTSAFYDPGDRVEDIDLSAGVFFQTGYFEVSARTRFPVNDFGAIGQVGEVTAGIGWGF